MSKLRSQIVKGAVTFTALTCCLPVLAQEGPGRQGTLSYSVGFDYDFDDGLEAISDLSFTFLTRTRSEELEFGIGTQLFGDFTDGGTDDFDFREDFLTLRYTRTGPGSRFDITGEYRERDLDDEVVGTIIADGGTLITTAASARLETGIEGPFGLSFGVSYRDRDFQDTTDPDLTDDTTVSANVVARFEQSESLAYRARAGITRIDDEESGGTETRTTFVGLGIETSNATGLTFRGDLLFDRVEETTTAPASNTTDDGIGFELGLTQSRPAGSVGFSLSSRIDDSGRRTEASVSRAFDTRTGGLAVSLGVVDQEDVSSLQVIGSVRYTMERPDGELSAGLARTATTDDGDAVLGTSLELAYRQEINPISSWSAELGYFETDDLGGGDDDDRTTASISYSRDLTSEWTLTTGYEYSRDDDGDTDNSVFFSIGRDITFGF